MLSAYSPCESLLAGPQKVGGVMIRAFDCTSQALDTKASTFTLITHRALVVPYKTALGVV